jgi:hypothetical protein
MALFAGSGIATVEDATVFNQLAQDEAIPLWRRRCAAWNVLSGTPLEGDPSQPFTNTERVDGRKVEVTIEGSARSLTGVSDGSDEDADASITTAAGFGAMEFDIAHLKDWLGIRESQLKRYTGQGTLKVASFIDMIFKQCMNSAEDTIEQHLFATGASVGPSRTRVGSLNHAISDYATSGESNYQTYGTIDRSDAANADFCSYVKIVPVLNLSDIGLAKMTVAEKLGQTKASFANATVLNIIRGLTEGYLDAEMDGDYVDFGGEKFRYGMCTFMLCKYATSGCLYGIDPEGWQVHQSTERLTEEGIMRVPHKKALYVLHYGPWVQVICKRPNTQWKFTGITQ